MPRAPLFAFCIWQSMLAKTCGSCRQERGRAEATTAFRTTASTFVTKVDAVVLKDVVFVTRLAPRINDLLCHCPWDRQ